MKNLKGEVDLITLVFGMVPMVLFIVLSAYIMVENPVQTDLGNQISFEEARFESMMALSHVLAYNDTLERINNYSEFPEQPNTVQSTIEDDINNSTEYLTDALLSRRYMVNVTMPEEDNISISTPNTDGAFISSELNVASPKTEPITVEVILDRG